MLLSLCCYCVAVVIAVVVIDVVAVAIAVVVVVFVVSVMNISKAYVNTRAITALNRNPSLISSKCVHVYRISKIKS